MFFAVDLMYHVTCGLAENNLFLVVTVGDFNARSSIWYISDKGNYEVTKIDCLAT